MCHPHLQRPPPSTPPRPPHPPARLRAHAPRGLSAGRATLSERAPPAGLRLVPPAVEHVSASVRHAARRQRLLQLHRPGLSSQADHDLQPDRGLRARPRPSRHSAAPRAPSLGQHHRLHRPSHRLTCTRTTSSDLPSTSPPPTTSLSLRAPSWPTNNSTRKPASGTRIFVVFSGPHFPFTTFKDGQKGLAACSAPGFLCGASVVRNQAVARQRLTLEAAPECGQSPPGCSRPGAA